MSNKIKNIIYIIGFILSMIICYQLAFSKTFKLKDEYIQLNQEATIFESMPKHMATLKKKEHYYDSLLTKHQIHNSSIQNTLLKTLNIYAKAHDLQVIDFIKPHTFKQDNLTIKIYQFELEGSYNNIQGLIYELEQHQKFGEIISVHLKKQKQPRTKRIYLNAKILLKSLS